MSKYIWLPLLLILLVVGCSDDSSSIVVTDENEDPVERQNMATDVVNEKTIGYSAMQLKNPFFGIIADSLKAEGAKHGFAVISTDANRDVATQSKQLEDFISSGVDAIVLNPTDKEAIGPAIKKANEAGIPVFTCDLQCVAEGVQIAGHIGTDNLQGGRLAGEAMVEVLGEDGGEVIVLDFNQAESCVLRVRGFKEIIDAANQERETGKIEIVTQIDGGGDREIGYKAASASLEGHPEARGIFAINDPSALGAWQAVKEADRLDTISIVGFDGELAGKRAILEEKIYADPIQFPKQMGAGIIEKLVAYQNGEDYEPITLIPTKLYKKADAEIDPDLQDGK
ncbi:MAG: substrate-binding domain-containing protein [Pirellulales bacterium]|nr:substrate-binding domain-containing protein [Pirellulales bacterium]